ncbi:MAG: hypothetical protein E7158_01440 [Firmicutes bacterium]|nr:hypothetical protein [Bacillota bacterium]
MILVTLGTQDKSFDRLLKQIDEDIENGNIKDKVIVQAGYTKYESNNMEIFDYVSQEKLNEYIDKCKLMITHAGVGSILNGIEKNKKVIVVPRLAKYKEQHNDHQVEIAEEFSKEGYVIYLKNLKDLANTIKNISKFEPRKLEHNKEVIKTIEEFIDNI